MMDPLLTALNATRGVVCMVGAGGKKTTMYALAALHPGRVALSSTSHMYQYDEAQIDAIVVADTVEEMLRFPPDARVAAFAGMHGVVFRIPAQQIAGAIVRSAPHAAAGQ